MIPKFKIFIDSAIGWLWWRKKLVYYIIAIEILILLLITVGASPRTTVLTLILAIVINYLTITSFSSIQYSEIFNNYTQMHIERLKNKVLKPQKFYISRNPIENDIRNWIEKNKTGFAVIAGTAGSGKTNLLFSLALELLAKNYAVLFIESDLLENFKKEKLKDESFSEILTSIKNKERKRTILLLDTLDLITYNSGLRKLIEFIGDIRQCDEGIIICSIRLPEYDSLKDKMVKNDETFFLRPFQKDEIEELFKRYNKKIDLMQEILNLLSIPLYAHMFIEVNEKEEILDIVNFVQLYDNYWKKKVESLRDGALPDYPQKDRDIVKRSKIKLIHLLASKIFENRNIRFNKTDFLRDVRDLENGILAYNDLISEQILIEQGNYIEFFHRTFFEYATARYLIEELADERLNELIKGTNLEISFYRVIFEYIAILAKNRDKIKIYKAIIEKLFHSSSHFQHILLINILNNLSKVDEYEIEVIENLICKDTDLSDYILGLMISDVWRPEYVNFTLLEELADHGEYELRRRITEALPKLILRNIELSLKLMDNLREDYDEEWRTDNRRRVIEAIPYLIKNGYLEVEDILRVRDDDEFYVIIAIIEVLDCLKCIDSEKAKRLIELLENQLNDAQKAFVSWLLDLLEKIRLKNNEAIEMMKAVVYTKDFTLILPSGDDAYRICVARNLHKLLKNTPSTVLEMMNVLIKPEEHKNVRRPLVRPVHDLIEFMIKEWDYKDEVEELILALATDRDEIIPITFSDNLSYLIKVAPDISKRIVNYYLGEEGKQTLSDFSDKGKKIIERRMEEIKQDESVTDFYSCPQF